MQRLTRGCGYRKVGALYLVGTGVPVACDRIPYKIPDCCQHCGAGIRQSRGITIMSPKAIGITSDGPCSRHHCASCAFGGAIPERAALMWIGIRHYPDPEDFIMEALLHGVSKRIAQVPRNLEIGKDWVYLAHPRGIDVLTTPDNCQCDQLELIPHIEKHRAIVWCFKPTAIEMPVNSVETSREELDQLEKRGITPILVDEDDDGYGVEYFDETEEKKITI